MLKSSRSYLLEFRSKAAVAFQGSRTTPAFRRVKKEGGGGGPKKKGFMPSLKFTPPTLTATRKPRRNPRLSEGDDGEGWNTEVSSIDALIEQVQRGVPTIGGGVSDQTVAASSSSLLGQSLAVERLSLHTEEDQLIRRLDRTRLLQEVSDAGWDRALSPAKSRRVQRLLAHVAAERSKEFTVDELAIFVSAASACSLRREALDIFYRRYETMTQESKDSGFALSEVAVDAAYNIQSLDDLVKLSQIGADEMRLHPNEILTDICMAKLFWRVACLAFERELTEKSRNLMGIDFASGQRVASLTKDMVEKAARSIYQNILKYNLWINGEAGKEGRPAPPPSPSRKESTISASYQLKMSPLSSFSSQLTPDGTRLLPFDEAWAALKSYVRYSYETDRGEMHCLRYSREQRLIYNATRILTRKLPTGEHRDILFRFLFDSCVQGRWVGQGQLYFDDYTAAVKDEEKTLSDGGVRNASRKTNQEVRRSVNTLYSYLKLLIADREHFKAVELAKGIFAQQGEKTTSSIHHETEGDGLLLVESKRNSSAEEAAQTFSGLMMNSSGGQPSIISPWLLAKLAQAAVDVQDDQFLKVVAKSLLSHPDAVMIKPPMVWTTLFALTQSSLKEEATNFLQTAIEKEFIKEGLHYDSLFELEAQVAVSLARQTPTALPVIESIMQSVDEKGIHYSHRIFLDAFAIYTEQEGSKTVSLVRNFVEQQQQTSQTGANHSSVSSERSSRQKPAAVLPTWSMYKFIYRRFISWVEAKSDTLLPDDRRWVIDFLKPNLINPDLTHKETDDWALISKLEADESGATFKPMDPKTNCFIRGRYGCIVAPSKQRGEGNLRSERCLERKQREAGIIGYSDEEAFRASLKENEPNSGSEDEGSERTPVDPFVNTAHHFGSTNSSVLSGTGNNTGGLALRYVPSDSIALSVFEKSWRRDLLLEEQLAVRKRSVV